MSEGLGPSTGDTFVHVCVLFPRTFFVTFFPYVSLWSSSALCAFFQFVLRRLCSRLSVLRSPLPEFSVLRSPVFCLQSSVRGMQSSTTSLNFVSAKLNQTKTPKPKPKPNWTQSELNQTDGDSSKLKIHKCFVSVSQCLFHIRCWCWYCRFAHIPLSVIFLLIFLLF